MSHTILLYGATGFSGPLVAAAAARRWSTPGATCRLVLGAREGAELEQLARRHGVDYRAFGLDDRSRVLRALRGVKVLVNAAGPFAWTGERLAKAAIEAGCHYVDINGEVDVYKRLDDLGRFAGQRDGSRSSAVPGTCPPPRTCCSTRRSGTSKTKAYSSSGWCASPCRG